MSMRDWFNFKGTEAGETVITGMVESMGEMDPDPPRRIQRFESNSETLTAEQRLEFGLNPRTPLRSYSKETPALGQNLMSAWTRGVSSRRQYLNIIEELDRYYIVDRLIEAMTEDVLNPNMKGECIDVASEDPRVKAALDDFLKKQDFNNLAVDITPDLFRFGEFTLRLEVDPDRQKGVTSINDDLNPLGVIALYEKGQPSNFLIMMNGDYVMMPAYSYAHFLLGDQKERIKIDDAFDPDYQIDFDKISPETKAKIPDYIRMGKPFFYGVVQKIRELMILEQILVALKLNQITQSKIIALKVPVGMAPKKVREALNDIESILNSEVAIDVDTNSLTVADLLSSAGRFKVVPNFGDEKGTLESLNVRDDAAVDDLLKSANDMRRIIMSAIGVPYSLIFESADEGGGLGGGEKSKVAELRRFGKYARKLSSVQRAIGKGFKQICLTHLVNLNNNEFNATHDSFEIIFTNAMVDLSGIEKLEYDDIKQEMILRKLDLMDRLASNPMTAKRLKIDNCLEFLNLALNDLTNGLPLLDVEDEKTEDDLDDELHGEFMAIAKDQFIQRLTARKAGAPILTVGSDEEQADIEQAATKAEEFVMRLKSAFALRRAKRERPIDAEIIDKGSTDYHPKTPQIMSRARDIFNKRRI